MTDKQETLVQTAVKVPESLLERADEVATKMSQPGMRVTRAEVLRMAMFKGVEALEAEKKKR